MFFYGHPQNRFWKVLASIYACSTPQTIEEKRKLVLDNHLALWDVIASCSIQGSADSAIQHVVPNDLRPMLQRSNIQHVFLNGKTAERYYKHYIQPIIGIPAMVLPSTSPANAAWSLERLTKSWSVIREIEQVP